MQPHPCANEPGWESVDGVWTRPLLGAESFLDQVHQLFDGHDQLSTGFEITTALPFSSFKSRVIRALIHLRYNSPLVASSVEAGRHDHQLRSWVYRPCQSLDEARSWAEHTLQQVPMVEDDLNRLAQTLVEQKLEERVKPNTKGQPFICFLVTGPGESNSQEDIPKATIFHANHALLDGPGALTTFKLFFKDVARLEDDAFLEQLKWGEEVKNLPVGPVAASGGPKEDWDPKGMQMLGQVVKALSQDQPSHSLKPARQEITEASKHLRVERALAAEQTAQILKAAKSLELSITQVLDAAFAVGTFRQNPDIAGNVWDAHITLFPAIISLRPHLLPMYPGHDPDTFLCIYDTGIPLQVPFAPKMLTTPFIGPLIISVAMSIKQQYTHFLSNPHLVHLMPASTALAPLREKSTDANPFWGEITNMGVIDSKVPRRYDDQEGKCVLEVGELVLALRQQSKRPMVHAWTIGGELKLQVQGTDVWEKDDLGKFLDEIIRYSKPVIRKKSSHSGVNLKRYGGFKSDGARGSTASSQPYQRRQSALPKSKRPPLTKSLDHNRFMSLPADIVLRVCRFLYPWNLLALARTSKELRAKFMTKLSKPYWNATRYLTGMPDWRTVTFPQAAATIYELECQGLLCSEESSSLALHLCRRYCLKCAHENLLDLEAVMQEFPAAPEDLVKCLPWTSRRTALPESSSEKKRFYLKPDVQKLCQRLDALGPLDGKNRRDLGRDLSAFQLQRKKGGHILNSGSTKEVQVWFEQDSRRRRKSLKRRWTIIVDVMRSRWGWKPVEYDQLGPRLKNIIDYLLDVTTLSEEAWAYVRGELEWAIREEAWFRDRNHDTRNFSLHAPPSPTKG
ncbi:hypothetical protein M407DRAFT_22108 [Tulasnella calospora MUT 4182]|uniref:F-box domain-containing protein n=1 Tax=Tulasnella calospora MUT 4182 TaxID=1051891 RepID=A0A0C3QLV4_9AGAM|nr:hypothetical protein M407DRAFT_22108 [Tulasnella calospora MUT 4182]